MSSFETQKKEFDAVADLVKRYNAITQVAIVSNDYPEVRFYYEQAATALMEAFIDNERSARVSFARKEKLRKI